MQTRVGGIPELLNDECGRLVPPRDPGALAQGLVSVLDRSWDAKSISASMSRSWDTVAQQFRGIFEGLGSGLGTEPEASSGLRYQPKGRP